MQSQDFSLKPATKHLHIYMEKLWLDAIYSHSEVKRLAYIHDANTIFLPIALIDFLKNACGEEYSTILSEEFIGRHIIYGFVSLEDAIYKYQYVPKPYTVVGQYIHHIPFNARIPVLLKDDSEVKKALLDILCGNMVAAPQAPYSFTWENQRLVFLGSFDLDHIFLPLAVSDTLPNHNVSSEIHYNYKPGFDLLDQKSYDQIVELSLQWERFKAEIESVCHKDIKKIFSGLKSIKMHKTAYLSTDESVDKLSEVIHAVYPELIGIDEVSLTGIYKKFHYEFYRFHKESELTRDMNFIYYILGNFVLDAHAPIQQLVDLGKYCGYLISKDQPLQNAIGLSLQTRDYQMKLSSLCADVNNALDFLHNRTLFQGLSNA